MTSEQERAFDAQAAAAGRCLWPGTIRMGGQTYAVSMVHAEMRVQFVDGDGAGIREVTGVRVELPKSVHADEPTTGTVFADPSDGDRLYRILRVGGRGPNDTVWYLEGVVEEGATI